MSSDMHPSPDYLESRIASLEARNAELEEAQKTVTCAFCARAWRRNDDALQTAVVMAQHMMTCEKHPLHHAGLVNTELRALLEQLAAASGRLCRQAEALRFLRPAADQVREVIGRVKAAGVEAS